MRSVTVHQLKSAQFDPVANTLVLDKRPLHLVTMVGNLTTVSHGTTIINCGLSDRTGMITLKKVVNVSIPDRAERIAREEQEHLTYNSPDIMPYISKYVCIIGLVVRTGHDLYVDVLNIRAVTDFNEITAHALQCIFEFCKK